MNTVPEKLAADYDLVGAYHQDEINGFDENTITQMYELADLGNATHVFDAMAGDGNLSDKLIAYCKQRSIKQPKVTMLEYSKVQCEIAASRPALSETTIIWGDMIEGIKRGTQEKLPSEQYDRIFIKSANHEIPLSQQAILYKNVFSYLKEGGLFINLGFLFENESERNEFTDITHVKDSLANLTHMVENRHFLTRAEFLQSTKAAGFGKPMISKPIVYTLRSWIAAENYFPEAHRDEYELELHAAQAKARVLRRNGKVVFSGERTTMYIPGEITVFRKPTKAEVIEGVYDEYPYDFLRNIRVHRELLESINDSIPQKARVADLGCGLGLLLERIKGKVDSYTGLDFSSAFVDECKRRFSDSSNATFMEADLNTCELPQKSFDVAVLANVLYQSAIDPVLVLKKAISSLKSGGLICISGPTSAGSFSDIKNKMRDDLASEGFIPTYKDVFQKICDANEKLLTERGNYWSLEGMIALLQRLGCKQIVKADNSIFYGSGYLVIARV